MIEIRPIKGLWDALLVRSIRNDMAFYMTNDRSHINILQQAKWYRRYKKNSNLHTFLVRLDGHPIGYGLVVEKDERCWVTGGILFQYRGNQYGEGLFRFLTLQAMMLSTRKESWLEVLKTNTRAFTLYRKLGYQISDVSDDKWIMRANEESYK